MLVAEKLANGEEPKESRLPAPHNRFSTVSRWRTFGGVPPGIFWRGFAGGRLEGCGAVLLDRYICVTDAQVLEIWANAIAHIPQWWWVVPRRVGATLHGGTHGIAEGCTVAL